MGSITLCSNPSSKKNKIYIADPEKGLMTYMLDEFCQIWTGILVLMNPSKTFKGNESKNTFSRFYFY